MKEDNLSNLRHSLAHLLAAAVLEIWPDTKRAIGPAIENGFYYDFEFSSPITDEDLEKIESKMREILPTWNRFEKIEVTSEEAKKQFANEPYKLELIDEFSQKGEKITLYKSGNYVDLCRGGHIENPQEINPDAFKLTALAGAYWRGDEKNKMLTRIYGVAFETKEELDRYLESMEKAKEYDHRKLGKELDLFVFSDLVGSGLPLWTPKGALIRKILDDYVWELRKKRGYQKVEIPHITKKELYVKSGHWSKFKDELFKVRTREKHLFAIKPMNCPHHTQIFDRKVWSYRELPQRYANTTMVYRDEQTGELHGLTRVRSVTQDDAHVFCREDQVGDEAYKIWDIIETFYKTFGFELKIRLSTHDPENMSKFLGTEKAWNKEVEKLKTWLEERNAEYLVSKGEAAFYGPKIDFIAKDSLNREWQVATLQIDKNLPKRFGLEYTNQKGKKSKIFMLHAAIMGSLERFMAIMIEHLEGKFPVWLSPTQVMIIPVSEKHVGNACKIGASIEEGEIRVAIDDSNETVGKKTRDAELLKVPYIVVVGDREIESGNLSVRKRGSKDLLNLPLEQFVSYTKEKIESKSLDL